MGTSFIVLSALESKDDQFRENVNLLIQDLKGQDIDLEKYTAISEHQIKTMVTNASLIESKTIKKDNGEFHKIIYSGDQGIHHLKFEQYYFIRDNKAYVLTFTAELSKFTTFEKIGETILNSFKLKQ